MQGLKFLHAADLHLDSPFSGLNKLPRPVFNRLKESTFAAFTNLITLAIREKVDFILLAGDLYDGEDRSLKAQLRIRKELLRLKEHYIDVFIIHGNHDHLSGSWIEMEWPQHVTIFDGDKAQSITYRKNEKPLAAIYGCSYSQRAVFENITGQFVKRGNEPYHIAMLHGAVEGSSEHDQYCPFKVKELLAKDFDYWALGHIHKREVLNSEGTPVIYPGNIQGRNRKEIGEKGCYIVEIDERGTEFEFHSLSDVIWEKREIEMEGISVFDDLFQECLKIVSEMRREHQAVCLFISLKGVSRLADELQQKQALDELKENLNEAEADLESFVWIEEIENQTKPYADLKELENDSVFFKDLLEIMNDYKEADQALSQLTQNPLIRKHLDEFSPEEMNEIQLDAQNLLLKSLLQGR
ncbi:metallophosphoesterase family protein [Metabacillus sp. RGM 3146]|uniref:metallophosphoesterase family protein n=1 Tax=Metabacillus sp. RGM 3146 TaxID=3401092 RepID=UPI003B994CBB